MIALLLFFFSVIGHCSDKVLQINIPVGTQVTQNIIGDWSSEKTTAARITSLGHKIKISAIQPGFFVLKDSLATFKVNVLSQTQWDTYKQLQTWTATRLGIKPRIQNGSLYLSGRLLNQADWLDLADNCDHCEYQTDFNFNLEIQKAISLNLKKILKTKNLKQLPLSFSPTAQWNSPNPSDEHRFLAKSLGINLVVDTKTLPPDPLIETQILVAEVRRDKVQSLGLKWPTSISSQILPAYTGASTATASLEAMENQGFAKTLASPKILCRSGETAEFLAGGEFPMKIKSGSHLDVVWRKYGVILKVQPKADRFGNMRIGLETEISSLDPNRSIDGLPGLISHRVMSHFDLSKTATIILSGLIRSEESKSAEGIPGLLDIPILGSLFSSEDYRNHRSELIILVQPRVVDSDSL